jgi:PAS domain S-box-containing protein
MTSKAQTLILDDDPRLLTSLEAIIGSQGHATTGCRSVQEAMEWLENRSFDLLLLDLRVGDENGLSVLDAVRDQGLETPGIVMTGYASTDSAVQALRKGAYDYLKKPFDPDELLTTVNNALSRKALVKDDQQLNGKLEQQIASTQDSHNLLRLICDNVPDLIWAKDLEGRLQFVNQAMCEKLLKCRSPEEALGKPVLYFAEQERKAGYEHTFGESCVDSDAMVQKTQSPGRFLEDGLVRNQYLVLDVHKAPLFDETQTMIGTVGCGREVTREKEIEEALQDSEQKYRALYDNAPLPYQSLDPEARILDVNPAWLKTLGYERGEVIGRPLAEFLHPDYGLAFEKAFEAFKRRGTIQTLQFKIRHARGHYLDVSYEGCTGHWSEGCFHRTYCVLKDVTDQKRAEAKLRQLDKAEGLQRMAGAIAHHYNNLLAAVIGNLELALEDAGNRTPLDKTLSPALESARRASQLSRQMLTYLGQSPGRTQVLDLGAACRETLSELRSELPDRIRLDENLPEEGLWVTANPEQVRQILDNVLLNAREALGPDGGRISLRLTRIDSKDIPTRACRPTDWQSREIDYACLEVMDEGCGMSAADQEKIFDPFFSTKFTGRGLGLPVVLGNVKNHEGSISVASAPGKGSTVRIYLPLSLETATGVTAQKPGSVPRPDATVLVIDDQDSVRKVARAMLERLGYQVLSARDGAEGLEVFQENTGAVQAVISDLSMPRMNGWETLTALRALRPELPVILASGYDETRAMPEAQAEQPQAFLAKPFGLKTLKQTLENILGGE